TLSFWDWPGAGCTIDQRPSPDCTTHQVAAKTGTSDNFKDNWTMGYTPNVVVGVWAGNATGGDQMENITGISGAAPIWRSVIEYASGRPCADIDPEIACPAKPLDRKALNL